MDQDDLEDELIWKTVVAHFDMASEKISYRVAYLVTNYDDFKFETLFFIMKGLLNEGVFCTC